MVSFQIKAIDFTVAFFNKAVVGYLNASSKYEQLEQLLLKITWSDSSLREMQGPIKQDGCFIDQRNTKYCTCQGYEA